jgi:plastocyanin
VRRFIAITLAALAATAALAVVADARRPRTKTVHLAGASFSAGTVKLKKGDRIKFVWDDGLHNVKRRRGPSFRNIGDRDAGSVTRTFRSRGTYRLVCTLHLDLGMRLTVKVS